MPLQNVIRLRFAFTNLACLFSSRPLSYCSLLLLSLSSLHSSLSPSLSTLLSIEYCSATCNFIIIIIKAHLMQEVSACLSFTVRTCYRKNLKGFSIVFYCSLSSHTTVLTRSQVCHRILLFTVRTHDCPNVFALTTALSGAHSGFPQLF